MFAFSITPNCSNDKISIKGNKFQRESLLDLFQGNAEDSFNGNQARIDKNSSQGKRSSRPLNDTITFGEFNNDQTGSKSGRSSRRGSKSPNNLDGSRSKDDEKSVDNVPDNYGYIFIQSKSKIEDQNESKANQWQHEYIDNFTPLNKTKLIKSFIFRAVRDLSRPVDHTVGIKCLIFKTEKYVLSSPEVVSFMKKII